MAGARRTLPGLGFSAGGAEYQPLDMGVGLLPSDDLPVRRRGCCRGLGGWTQGRGFNVLVAVTLCINALLIGLETDLGLLGDGTPAWSGLEADAKLLGNPEVVGAAEARLEGSVADGLQTDAEFKGVLQNQINASLHRYLDVEDDLRLRKGASLLRGGAYTTVEFALVLFYIVELLLRVCDVGCNDAREEAWNKFDFVMVLLGLADLSFPFVLLTGPQVSLTALELLSALRVSRSLRLLRFFRVLPELRELAKSCAVAFYSVLWVGTVLLIVNFLLASMLTSLIGQNAQHWGDRADEVRLWFGSVGRSLQTLFGIIMLSGWGELALVLSAVIPPTIVGLGLLVYILLCFFAMLSLLAALVNASLVAGEKREELLRLSDVEELRASFAEALTSLFGSCDLNKSGWLSRSEFKASLDAHPAVLAQLLKMDVDTTVEELMMLFDRLSHDSSAAGSVEIMSLVESIVLTNGAARSSEVFDVKYLVVALRRELATQMDILKHDLAKQHQKAALDHSQLAGAAQHSAEAARRGEDVAAAVAGLAQSVGATRGALTALASEVSSMASKVEILTRQREQEKASGQALLQDVHRRLDELMVFAQAGPGTPLAARLDALAAAATGRTEDLAELLCQRLVERLPASLSMPPATAATCGFGAASGKASGTSPRGGSDVELAQALARPAELGEVSPSAGLLREPGSLERGCATEESAVAQAAEAAGAAAAWPLDGLAGLAEPSALIAHAATPTGDESEALKQWVEELAQGRAGASGQASPASLASPRENTPAFVALSGASPVSAIEALGSPRDEGATPAAAAADGWTASFPEAVTPSIPPAAHLAAAGWTASFVEEAP